MPDGQGGPWADAVVSSSQSFDGSGRPVRAERSDVAQALGPAEDTDTASTAYSLGLRGQLTVRFENAACNGPGPDLALVETTREPYGPEEAAVYASAPGGGFVRVAASLIKDGAVSLPADMPSAERVLVVDVTDRESGGGATADGYDVDGIRALHPTGCAAPAPAGTTDSDDPGAGPGSGRDPAITEPVLPARPFVPSAAHRRVRILSSRLRRDGRGTVRVAVRNHNAYGVFVSATIRPRSTSRRARKTVYARARAALAVGPRSRRLVKLRLNRRGLRVAKRRTRLRLVLVIRDPSGVVRSRSYGVSIAAKR